MTHKLAQVLQYYWQLSYGISVYHWELINTLVWFSSVTHIATLPSLREYFQRRPTLAYCRITAIGMNLILLGVASPPANYHTWVDKPSQCYGLLASCFYEQQPGPIYYHQSLKVAMMTASLTFLVTSYTMRVIRISTICSRITHKWFRVKPGNWVKKSYSEAIDHQARMQNPVRKKLWCFWKRQLTLFYVVFKALYEVGNSTVWEVCSFDTLIIYF